MTKQCSICQLTKPTADFDYYTSNREMMKPSCRACNIERGKIYRQRKRADRDSDIYNAATDADVVARFWSKVAITANPDRCWEWQAGGHEKGYGYFSISWHNIGAHRFSVLLATGKIPTQFVLHSCDNPKCVNPNHLREGTRLDNARDACERGQQVVGDTHPRSILNSDQVKEIKTLLGQKVLMRDIAARFGVSQGTISAISTGRNWGHI